MPPGANPWMRSRADELRIGRSLVTPRFAMSAGLGPYIARNRRDDNITHGNLLITFQAEQALSRHTRAFVNFNRVKTFRQTDDRDLFQLGLLTGF
jgi:hypothetical protein